MPVKIILVLVRENSPKRFSHPAYSCSHSVLFTLLTTPRKAAEPSDINERCTASPLCQRPRFCCCLFSAMNLEELQNSICNNVFLSNGCWCCQLLQHENTTVDSTEKNCNLGEASPLFSSARAKINNFVILCLMEWPPKGLAE